IRGDDALARRRIRLSLDGDLGAGEQADLAAERLNARAPLADHARSVAGSADDSGAVSALTVDSPARAVVGAPHADAVAGGGAVVAADPGGEAAGVGAGDDPEDRRGAIGRAATVAVDRGAQRVDALDGGAADARCLAKHRGPGTRACVDADDAVAIAVLG